MMEPTEVHRYWVVVVPQGSWTRCYGLFDSYEASVDWTRRNQWHPSDVGIYPVVGIDVEQDKAD